jgi:hypothetical protein
MKKIIFLFVCVFALKGFAQKGYTTAYLFTNHECGSCTIQFATNKKPFGPLYPVKRDTMFVGISPKSSGFFVYCRDTMYFETPYKEDGFYKIKMPCKTQIFIKKFHQDPTSNYISNINTKDKLEFYFNTKKEMDEAKFYVISDFKKADVAKLFQTKEVLKKYFPIQVGEDYYSVPGDLIFTMRNNQIVFFNHIPVEHPLIINQ